MVRHPPNLLIETKRHEANQVDVSQFEMVRNVEFMSKQKIAVLGDFHSGHVYGLAVPDECVNQFQRKGWNFLAKGIEKYGPYDRFFLMGDLIDGRGKKNGGMEAISPSLKTQSDMAINCINELRRLSKSDPKMTFVRGTPYHTDGPENWEDIVAKEFRNHCGPTEENIYNQIFVDVDGVIFDLKHHCGGGQNPQTRPGAPAREIVQAMLKENYHGESKADCFIRAHVHYHTSVNLLGRIAYTNPALQINSDYGELRCSGIVDYGFTVVEVENGKLSRIIPVIAKNPIKERKVVR